MGYIAVLFLLAQAFRPGWGSKRECQPPLGRLCRGTLQDFSIHPRANPVNGAGESSWITDPGLKAWARRKVPV
jgi:hypothetical protein